MKNLYVRNIKKGFATNSSSYHSTLVMTKEEYDKWINSDIEINGYASDEWFDTEYETERDNYTTPGGERIVILSKFGYNG